MEVGDRHGGCCHEFNLHCPLINFALPHFLLFYFCTFSVFFNFRIEKVESCVVYAFYYPCAFPASLPTALKNNRNSAEPVQSKQNIGTCDSWSPNFLKIKKKLGRTRPRVDVCRKFDNLRILVVMDGVTWTNESVGEWDTWEGSEKFCRSENNGRSSKEPKAQSVLSFPSRVLVTAYFNCETVSTRLRPRPHSALLSWRRSLVPTESDVTSSPALRTTDYRTNLR